MIYMATTTSKYVDTDITVNHDGILDYPTTSEGSVTQTNGGSKSIIFSGNYKTLPNTAGLDTKLGAVQEIRLNLFYINKQI